MNLSGKLLRWPLISYGFLLLLVAWSGRVLLGATVGDHDPCLPIIVEGRSVADLSEPPGQLLDAVRFAQSAGQTIRIRYKSTRSAIRPDRIAIITPVRKAAGRVDLAAVVRSYALTSKT